MKASFRAHRDARQAGGRAARTARRSAAAGRSRWSATRRIALDDPQDPASALPEVTLGLLPGASGITKTVRMLGLKAALPLPARRQAASARARRSSSAWSRRSRPTPTRCCAAGARLDRRQSRRRSSPGTSATTGCRAARRRARRSPQASRSRRRCCCRRRAASIPAPEAILETMVEGALRRLRHRAADREHATSPSSWSSQTAKNMIQRFFFDLQRDQVRRVAAGGRPELEAAQGRHPRRRHDGRGHRPCQRGARHRRAC